MDVAYAGAIKMGVDAVRSARSDAYAGIAGGQMPGWAGTITIALRTRSRPLELTISATTSKSAIDQPRIAVVTTPSRTARGRSIVCGMSCCPAIAAWLFGMTRMNSQVKMAHWGDRGREVAPYYTKFARARRPAHQQHAAG